ncbi:ABC-2 type transport system permease protein [Chitinophaga jiangningensis]|uniref:ABC-2 type transport system permease protein n=1 Tax=Chitinophaga jiangningensis TaxID=1419482 RepID=A0A1M7AN50_9BACT|nr:ABC transporter permease [Chitinophaga jiangningensis]SHL44148.1 ABC-2 type transport system permease protein [Chitinophaga jiangningensis]
MKKLGFLLQKEFRQILRDRIILVMIFAMPTIQLIILPLAANFEVKDIKVVVVDHDHSTLTQRMLGKLGASGYFRITGAVSSYQEALHYVERNDADVVLEIPVDFERNLVREGRQQVSLSIDAINGARASIGGAYLNSIIADFSQGTDLDIVRAAHPVPAGMPVINVTYNTWYNPREQYKYYMVPGIFVLLLTLIGGFMSALNIVKEKEIGTIEQINVTPIRKWEFISGKLIPFWLMGLIIFTIGLLVAWVVYGIVSVGPLWLLYLFAAVYLVALLGFGLLISTYSANQVQAMFLAFFFMLIFMLMSGLFTATESMPGWARTISALTPVTHFVKVIRMVMLKGSGFADVQLEFLYEIAFALVLNAWAVFNYRKTS